MTGARSAPIEESVFFLRVRFVLSSCLFFMAHAHIQHAPFSDLMVECLPPPGRRVPVPGVFLQKVPWRAAGRYRVCLVNLGTLNVVLPLQTWHRSRRLFRTLFPPSGVLCLTFLPLDLPPPGSIPFSGGSRWTSHPFPSLFCRNFPGPNKSYPRNCFGFHLACAIPPF